MNRNYRNGRAREYRIMKDLKKQGYDIIFRSAGSHSPIDIVGIKKAHDGVYSSIIFIQSKPKKFSKVKKALIEEEFKWLNDEFMATFQLLSQLKGGKE